MSTTTSSTPLHQLLRGLRSEDVSTMSQSKRSEFIDFMKLMLRRSTPHVYPGGFVRRSASCTGEELKEQAGDDNGDNDELKKDHCSVVRDQDSERNTVLHLAVACGFEGAVALLLEWSTDPNLLNVHGNTALDIAEALGNTAIPELLLDKDAIPKDCGDDDGDYEDEDGSVLTFL